MPYIDPEDRATLDAHIERLGEELDEFEVGHLNYAITRLVDAFATRFDTFSYGDSVNDVVGVLECVKLEFYRRCAVPYEDVKRELNGDVYPFVNDRLEQLTS